MKMIIQNWWQYLYEFLFKKLFVTKILYLRIDSAATIGARGKVTYFMYFPWPPHEA
jgi:hypothetical protein